jgi:hypothetical protein
MITFGAQGWGLRMGCSPWDRLDLPTLGYCSNINTPSVSLGSQVLRQSQVLPAPRKIYITTFKFIFLYYQRFKYMYSILIVSQLSRDFN